MRFWEKRWERYSGFRANRDVGIAHGRAPQAGRLNSARFAHTLTGNFSIRDGYAFLLQHLFLLFQTTGVSGEFSVRADDSVAGDGGGVGVFVEGVADGAIAASAELFGDVGVGEDLALWDSSGQGPDFLIKRHLRRDLAGVNGGFDFGHNLIVAPLGVGRQVKVKIAPGFVQ